MSGRKQWGDDSTVCVKLSASASVTLTFKGNVFDLAPEEVRLISALTDVMQKHQEAAKLAAKQP